MVRFVLTNLPNPSCCRTDNPAHLCPRCRAAYQRPLPGAVERNAEFAEHGYRTRETVHNVRGATYDPTPGLPIPTLNDVLFGESQPRAESDNEIVQNGYCGANGGEEMLPRSLNFAAIVANDQRQRNSRGPAGLEARNAVPIYSDDPITPTIDWAELASRKR